MVGTLACALSASPLLRPQRKGGRCNKAGLTGSGIRARRPLPQLVYVEGYARWAAPAHALCPTFTPCGMPQPLDPPCACPHDPVWGAPRPASPRCLHL
jgi:hypothetical protein